MPSINLPQPLSGAIRLITCLAALPVLCSGAPLSANDPLVLAQEKTALFTIIVGQDAIPAEQTAARELASCLNAMSGARFEIIYETQTHPRPSLPGRKQILVGATARVRDLLPNVKWDNLGADSIIIKTLRNGSDEMLILAGSRPRGTLYAVYSFLSDTLDVQWFAPDETQIPALPTLKIPPQDTLYAPPFATREVHTNIVYQKNPWFATRLRLNGHFQNQGAELGGHNSILGFCHTFFQLLPPSKYFKEHPEWYTDVNNNNKPCTARSPQPNATAQLCMTNEPLRKELVRVALDWIRKNPAAGTISISQEDNDNYCTCSNCKALETREGSPSGPLLHFVNAVAADIRKEHPGFLIDTLAYTYTRKPPRHVRPADNVIIRLCSIECDRARTLDSTANAGFRDDLLQWRAISRQLFVWDYVANYRNLIFPYPNIQPMAENIRFLANNKVIGLFEQGDSYSNGSGDLIPLRTWLLAQLMWDPSKDQDQLIQKFLAGYYGAAAPFLRRYIDEIRTAFMKTGERLRYSLTANDYLTIDVMNNATRLFDHAEKSVASSEKFSRRVRQARMPLDHAWILRYTALRDDARRTGKAFEGPENVQAFIDEFIRDGIALGIHEACEGQPFKSYAARLRARFFPRSPLPPAFAGMIPKNIKDDDIVDVEYDQLRLTGEGRWASLVDDPAASRGRAARLVGNTTAWAIQYPLDNAERAQTGNWHVYLLMRADQGNEISDTTDVMTCGVYSYKERGLASATKTWSDIGHDSYKVIDLGTCSMRPDAAVWIAPVNTPAIKALYVDRIILVRQR